MYAPIRPRYGGVQEALADHGARVSRQAAHARVGEHLYIQVRCLLHRCTGNPHSRNRRTGMRKVFPKMVTILGKTFLIITVSLWFVPTCGCI